MSHHEDILDTYRRYYTLDGDAINGPFTFNEWLTARDPGSEHMTERVARDELPTGEWVSTVFLSLDHSHWDGGAPILFETMVFEGEHDSFQWRYRTLADALDGHAKILAAIKAGTDPDEAMSS